MKEIAEDMYQDENEHVIDLWTPCEFHIDKEYEYVPKGFLFSLFSNLLYYGIAYPVLTVLTKVIYDLKIEGEENVKSLKTGAISVSNHVMFLDCAMTGLSFRQRKIFFTTQEDSFKIPVVRKLIRLLKAIPIPENIENKKYFLKEINNILKQGDIVHIYPEASLWPYCTNIRNFKNGAFDLAVKNEVPIIPIVYTFRNPKGIRKFLKKKPDVTVTILKPVEPNKEEPILKQRMKQLKEIVYTQMKEVVENKKVKKTLNTEEEICQTM